jgi:hypothetical protein
MQSTDQIFFGQAEVATAVLLVALEAVMAALAVVAADQQPRAQAPQAQVVDLH